MQKMDNSSVGSWSAFTTDSIKLKGRRMYRAHYGYIINFRRSYTTFHLLFDYLHSGRMRFRFDDGAEDKAISLTRLSNDSMTQYMWRLCHRFILANHYSTVEMCWEIYFTSLFFCRSTKLFFERVNQIQCESFLH